MEELEREVDELDRGRNSLESAIGDLNAESLALKEEVIQHG